MQNWLCDRQTADFATAEQTFDVRIPIMNATANNLLRIIAEENHGHWSARFDDPRFPDSYGGSDALGAIRRLVENSPHLGFVVDDFEPDWHECSNTRLVMVFVGEIGEPCPDCGGTGKYVGLHVIEPCQGCEGTGRA